MWLKLHIMPFEYYLYHFLIGGWISQLCGSLETINARHGAGLSYVMRERMHCHQVQAREAYWPNLLAIHAELEQSCARLACPYLNCTRNTNDEG